MKRIWKVLVSLVLVLIAGAGGAANTYDMTDEKVEEITRSKYNIILPEEEITEEALRKEGNNTVVATSGSGKTSAIVINAKAANITSGEPKAEKAVQNKNDPKVQGVMNKTKPAKPTVASIKKKYYPTFEHLQKQADKKVDLLIAEAYKEYSNQQLKGDSISYMYFYQKYTEASSDLESNANAAFNQIYKALQEDLKRNGFSPSHAKSFKEEYEAAKKAREASILSKIKEAL